MKKYKKPLPLSKKMKILFAGSEAAPFAKAGGLGDVMYSLPLTLREAGHDARVFIPRYGTIDPQKYRLKMEVKGLRVPTDQPGNYHYLVCNVKKYSGGKSVPAYFLENMEYYEKRANVYGYMDDHIRWALFCRGVAEFLRKSKWKPDIIVSSDWQTGLLPNYLKTKYTNELGDIPVVFMIHNFSYQGMCDFRFMKESEKDSGQEEIPDFFNSRLAKLNWMKRGIIYSDGITTVSPTYAKEILTKENGYGLHELLQEKQGKFWGVLNGINYNNYDPTISDKIPAKYSVASVEKKKENKSHLQKRFGLPEDKSKFIAGMVSRLSAQKGFDLIEQIIDPFLKNLSAQIIFLGDGDSAYKEMIEKKRREYPDKLGYIFEFDTELPHLVFAGSDATLLPSKFEPCGIVQMQAMKYGSVPIARATGGLDDTINNFFSDKKSGDGFLFYDYEPMSFYTTLVKAQTIYSSNPSVWKKITKRAMKKDFSWENSARQYLKIFREIIKNKK